MIAEEAALVPAVAAVAAAAAGRRTGPSAVVVADAAFGTRLPAEAVSLVIEVVLV